MFDCGKIILSIVSRSMKVASFASWGALKPIQIPFSIFSFPLLLYIYILGTSNIYTYKYKTSSISGCENEILDYSILEIGYIGYKKKSRILC
jgi:hypothetical protein